MSRPQPTWKLQKAARGQTLVVGGFTYHPGDDPVRRGRMEAMEAAVVIDRQGGKKALLIGFGLGYLAAPLSSMLDIPLAIWDCLPVAMQYRRDRFLMAAARATVLHSEGEVEQWLDEDTIVVTHNSAADLHYWQIQFCESVFFKMNRRQIKSVSKRSVAFLERLPSVGLVREHYGKALPTQACVICSPGPTLDVQRVRQYADRGYPVIAAAQCLPQLNAAGVVPLATVCLDPQPLIYDRLKAGTDPGWIYADAMSDPRIWDDFPDRCFAFSVPSAHCHASIWRQMGYDWIDDPSITVSEVMLQIANKLGFGVVITSGVDYYAPMRTPLLSIECEGGLWSWSHYLAGASAWRYLLGKYPVSAVRLEDQDHASVPTQQPLVLPAPASKIPEAIVRQALSEMLSSQPQQISEQVMSALSPSIREAFSPLNPVPIMVNT